MNKKHSSKNALMLKLAIAGATALGAQASLAQDYYYIQHKPTGFQFSSCSSTDGTPVIADASGDTSACSQWEQVTNGSFFHLKNRESGKFIRPDTANNGSPIVVQPSSWTGNWTQWSYQDTGDGFGHLINRSTGKNVYISAGGAGADLEQQPASWSGDYTRWSFVSVGGSTPEPTPTATPTPDVTPTPVVTPTPDVTPTPVVTPTPAVTPTPTPTDGPVPGSETVEAESGALSGNAQIYTDGAASGGQGVAYIYEIGDSIGFTNVRASDSITLRYASENANGSISVRVNSADVGNISFTGTGAWVGNYAEATLNTDIPANATVEIFFDSGDMAMNIDTVTFSLSGPTPTPEPTATPDPNVTQTPTPEPTATPTPGCGMPDVDPVAEYGDGMAVGVTNSGIAYHREVEGAARGFAIWGLQGSAPNVAGQTVLHTTQSGESYYRYEVDVSSGAPSFQVEMRLQGNEFGGGQCIQSWTFEAGQGEPTSSCFVTTGGGGPIAPPPPPSATGMVVTNGQAGQARLVGGPGSEKPGFALYTFGSDSANVSNCSGQCEDNWPKLIVKSEDDAIAAGGVTGTFGTIPRTRTITDDCGNTTEVTDYHVTYDGAPLYFFAGDSSEGDTSGASINNWFLADADLIAQLPLVKNPAPALKSTINGLTPNNFGYAIDIDGRTLTWRPSAYNGNQSGLIQQFSPWAGDGQPLSAKDPNLELWCSNNQIQFHKADMPGTLAGPYTTEIPGACYGKFYYFLRYRIYGTVNNEPEDNWVYTALYEYDETNPNDRIDPRTRPVITDKSANWQRHGHPHSRDRPEEWISIDAQPYNTSSTSGLERYTTDYQDGPNTFQVQPNANGSILRIEAFEWGAGNCQGPQYMINANNPMGAGRFDYGQIISWEATFGSSQNNFPGGTGISSQIYNTMQNTTVGAGFSTSTGDPRLNLAGRAGVRMVHSSGCNPVEDEERNARFTQQLTSVQSATDVDDFIKGHHLFHGQPNVSGGRPNQSGFAGSIAIPGVKPAGEGSCGDCHFRDGRSSHVFQTAKGPLIAPPTYGVGLLQYIEGAEVGLTWDGSAATVRQQAENALLADLGLRPSDIGQTEFDQVVKYTEQLHVPVREYKSYADPDVAAGEVAFHEVGCASCHQPTQKTSSGAPAWAADLYIRPYTDMKLWDVGTGGSFRTAPLWGIGQNRDLLIRNGRAELYMHDGRATSLGAAIDAHGNGSVQGMSGAQRANIIKFLETL